jgi:hypothetical protein
LASNEHCPWFAVGPDNHSITGIIGHTRNEFRQSCPELGHPKNFISHTPMLIYVHKDVQNWRLLFPSSLCNQLENEVGFLEISSKGEDLRLQAICCQTRNPQHPLSAL